MKTILVIDDEPDIIDIVADQIDLLGLGVNVIKATTVEEAQNQIDNCDMIISDVKMPNREKLETILQDSNKPVARITGHDDFRGIIEQLLQRCSNTKC